MCARMNVKSAFLCASVSLFVLTGMANAEIIVPMIVSEANTNPYSTATTDKLTDNSGMTPAVNAGDSLAPALAAIHANTGVFDSWVTNASAPDYFAASQPPVIVWDLTAGGDKLVGTAILWQYQNDGGGDNRVGNHARTIELRFNTEAEGSAVFSGPATTITMRPVLTGEQNAAQDFDLASQTCRYVQMTVTDNHYGDPDGFGVHVTVGGDRVGLGEVRFAVVPAVANTPDPVIGATDVCRNVVLGWNSGADAEKHDVYLGTDFDDVSNASISDPRGVLVSPVQGQIENYYPVSGTLNLAFGTTYYWRIDEVKGVPASRAKGAVWKFLTEPFVYSIGDIAATASSYDTEKDPNKTIDGSGLDADDLHSKDTATMWLSAGESPGEAWIQYEFDKIYRLYEMLVWNYNGEGLNTAYGIRDATIEYSTNGIDFTTLGATQEFPKAPGADGYAAGPAIDFGGVTAKHVRITAEGNWGGGVVDQYGLSEVRFSYVPVRARNPLPESEATNVPVDTVLSWIPGREAAVHEVYLSTDVRAVMQGTFDPCSIAVDGACRATYDPQLELGRTYYWKVNEANMAETPETWEGETWRFSTPAYLVVDDMLSYGDVDEIGQPDSRIWYTWKDGEGWTDPEPTYPGNGTGSVVDLNSVPVHDTQQSMAFHYSNNGTNLFGTMGKKYYSEATALISDLGIGHDWTADGIRSLTLYFYGAPGNATGPTEQMYVKLNGAKVPYDGDVNDVTEPSWHEWNIDLAVFGINLQNVTQISIGFGDEYNVVPGGTGVVVFDDIRLYPARCIPSNRSDEFALFDYAGQDCVINYREVELMAADWLSRDRVAPPLIGWYKFDEGFGTSTQDSSGNNNHGTLNGAPVWRAGHIGAGSLQFNGSDEVEVPYNPALNPTDTFTVAAWINLTPGGTGHRAVVSCRDDLPGPARGYILYVQPDATPSFWTGRGNANGWYSATGPVINEGQWVHVAGTYEVGALSLFVDGVLEAEGTAATFGINTVQNFLIGAGRNERASGHDYYFQGQIDDVRMYDRALSQGEIASIMNGTLGSVSEYHPLRSLAEVDASEPEGSRAVNFKDFAALLSRWLDMELWP